mgnify:CR=1 FL=1
MRRVAGCLAVAGALLCVAAGPARAEFGIGEAQVRFVDRDGSVLTQAGAHPYVMETQLLFDTVFDPTPGLEQLMPAGEARNVIVSLSPGFAGNPTAVDHCPNAVFFASAQPGVECPPGTQLGRAEVIAPSPEQRTNQGIYNLAPPPGGVAKLGFLAFGVPVSVELRVSPQPPHSVIATVDNIPQVLPFYGSVLRVWGVPGDPGHDAERSGCGSSCNLGLQPKPFLVLPRSCSPATDTLFEVDSWEAPGQWARHLDSGPGLTGCSRLGFDAVVASQPTTTSAQSPSGLDFTIQVEDEGLKDPEGIAQSDLRKSVVTLPEGMTANPAVANGLQACSEAQFASTGIEIGVGGCPQASKVGSVEVETPLLEGVLLRGEVYVAEQHANPFGSLLALYMVIREPQRGILIKLPGKVEPDPETGRLTTTFGLDGYEVPQFPFSRLRLSLRGGARAPLVTPPSCDGDPSVPGNQPYRIEVAFHPWADPDAVYRTEAYFTIDSGPGGGPCPAGPGPFEPALQAGTQNNAASEYSPLSMRITRNDGEAELTRFDAELPPGLAAKIAGVARCPDSALAAAAARSGREEAAAPSCPADSQIGRTLVGAGVGPELTYVPGRIYLAGPYAGAPLSVAAVTPAVAGPFDVGTVVTRLALDIDPTTAAVRVDGAASLPIPRILKGIPLRIRDIRVYIDRSAFTFNASNCKPMNVQARFFGSFADRFQSLIDRAAAAADRYQAADCALLGFNPKLQLQLKGGTKRGRHPALRSTVTYPYPSGPGYANIGGATVILPPSQFIDNAHINNPCTRVQFNEGRCPRGSILGRARAITPLLDEPLEGPVIFRANGGERELPDIVADLRGQFHVVLVGFVDTITPKRNARIRTRFVQVPDAPVTKFTLNLFGGKRGLLVNSRNLCTQPQRGRYVFRGQNGKRKAVNVVYRTDCKKKGAKRSRHARAR